MNGMSSRLIACILMGSLMLTLGASAQGPTGKIATVDLDKLFNDYYKTPIASVKLKETADSYTKEQGEMLASYKKQIDELNKLREDQDKPEYTAAVREQKRKAVAEQLTETQKLQRDIEDYRTTHRRILEEQTQRMRQTILKEINDVIDKESRAAGYQLVFDKSGSTLNGVPTIVFAQDSLDITDEIAKILNKNQSKTTGARNPAEKKEETK
jgi:outer membrane protein